MAGCRGTPGVGTLAWPRARTFLHAHADVGMAPGQATQSIAAVSTFEVTLLQNTGRRDGPRWGQRRTVESRTR